MKTLRTLALFLAATSLTAFAQKPTLTKDTEANGRTPYIHTLEWQCPLAVPGWCVSHINSFPAVPAGYRLVVTYLSARFPDGSAPASISMVFNNGLTASDSGYVAMNLLPPTCNGSDPAICIYDAPVSFYVEAMAVPTLVITTGSPRAYVDQEVNLMRVTIVGYLISQS